MIFNFISLCSGIEAASVAFEPIGWRAIAFSEIEPFPSAVLAHHHPSVPNMGDMSKFAEWPEQLFIDADAIVGGPPCQAFSVAGRRAGLDDARGNLTLTYAALINHADDIRVRNGRPPVICLYENVPGLLSDKTGAFGCLLGGLAGEECELVPPGKRWEDAGAVLGPKRSVAWRTLDAQWFGLAQRRRRVFVVASARNGFDPAEVLFERDGVRRDSAPSREPGQSAAGCLASRTEGGGFPGTDEACSGYVQPVEAFGGNRTSGSIDISPALLAQPGSGWKGDFESETFLVQPVAHTLRGEGFDASEDGAGRGTPLVPVAHVETMPTMMAGGPSSTSHNQISGQMRDQYLVPMAFDTTQITSQANRSNPQPGDPCHPLAAGAHPPAIAFQAGNLARGAGSPPNTEVFPTLKADHGRGLSDQHPCVAFPANLSGTQHASAEDLAPSMGAMNPTAVAVALRGREGGATAELGEEVQNCLRASSGGGDKPHVLTAMQVRRLTPVECERLQGFPDDYTAIPWRKKPASECPDGPRYKALGNSWAVPVVAWIGRRIDAVLERLEPA